MQDSAADNLLADGLDSVRREIRRCAEKAGRNADEIQLIAVSKTRSLDELCRGGVCEHPEYGQACSFRGAI